MLLLSPSQMISLTKFQVIAYGLLWSRIAHYSQSWHVAVEGLCSLQRLQHRVWSIESHPIFKIGSLYYKLLKWEMRSARDCLFLVCEIYADQLIYRNAHWYPGISHVSILQTIDRYLAPDRALKLVYLFIWSTWFSKMPVPEMQFLWLILIQ